MIQIKRQDAESGFAAPKFARTTLPVEKAISLDEFDEALRQFLKAPALAGVALPTDTADVISLFKKP
ncbi:hypothetical protein [Bradyrhizobium sp. OK095]|uniref:hypothetical protein n=1 Tax=Bradyrhizobium sp. OK095 TaxID=1882760 RepID=UPI00115FB07C|nr:hypothetical protein [Bradyrhizobium sp. OK095]